MDIEINEPYLEYKRRSEEDKEKQIISIPSQERAIRETLYFTKVRKPLADFKESKTAKEPGRQLFNQMCEMLEAGKAKIIVCWQLNRLARNPVDGGRIIWLVQRNGVKIITPHKVYDVNDILQMYVEFAMANNFILDLQKTTKRGLEEKLIAGNAPIRAPIGYRNTVWKKQGLREIIKDDEQFLIVRKMWDLFLTGNYTPPKILKIATEEWGLRQQNKKPLSRTQVYRLFTNLFYTGQYMYSGKLYQGIHKPMITIQEFDRAQVLLGVKGKPRLRKHEFAYTDLMLCICGSSITLHERYRKTCTKCHKRFNPMVFDRCPVCKEPAPAHMLYFCYAHCTRRKNPNCKQPHIRVDELEKQIDEILQTITIPGDFVDWALKKLRKDQEEEVTHRGVIVKNLHAAHAGITRRIDNLSLKYFSEGNKDGGILSDDEYKKLKIEYINEQREIEEQIGGISARQATWLETSELVLNFARQARTWFANGTVEQKRDIAHAFGLNLVLENKKLSYTLLKPFEKIKEASERLSEETEKFEPANQPMNQDEKAGKTHIFDPENTVWGG